MLVVDPLKHTTVRTNDERDSSVLGLVEFLGQLSCSIPIAGCRFLDRRRVLHQPEAGELLASSAYFDSVGQGVVSGIQRVSLAAEVGNEVPVEVPDRCGLAVSGGADEEMPAPRLTIGRRNEVLGVVDEEVAYLGWNRQWHGILPTVGPRN